MTCEADFLRQDRSPGLALEDKSALVFSLCFVFSELRSKLETEHMLHSVVPYRPFGFASTLTRMTTVTQHGDHTAAPTG